MHQAYARPLRMLCDEIYSKSVPAEDKSLRKPRQLLNSRRVDPSPSLGWRFEFSSRSGRGLSTRVRVAPQEDAVRIRQILPQVSLHKNRPRIRRDGLQGGFHSGISFLET